MTYVMSDIHGAYEQFLSLLSQINLGEDDILYIAGDLVDYGEKGMELVGDLSVRLNVYPVAGDHDYTAARMLHGFDKLLRAAEAGENADPDPDYIAEMSAWVRDGGQPTLDGFRTLNSDEREGVLDYLGDLPLFEEFTVNGTDYLMVHAGIAAYRKGTDPDDYSPEDFFSEVPDAEYPLVEGKTLLVGHVRTKSGKIERGVGSIFLDCGAETGGKLGCLRLEDGKEFYA